MSGRGDDAILSQAYDEEYDAEVGSLDSDEEREIEEAEEDAEAAEAYEIREPSPARPPPPPTPPRQTKRAKKRSSPSGRGEKTAWENSTRLGKRQRQYLELLETSSGDSEDEIKVNASRKSCGLSVNGAMSGGGAKKKKSAPRKINIGLVLEAWAEQKREARRARKKSAKAKSETSTKAKKPVKKAKKAAAPKSKAKKVVKKK
jgi:hypothetical protein